MFRSAVLRSTAAAVRTASMRPMSTAARRTVLAAAAPRISLAAAPRAVAWQAVRCYSAAGGLEKKDVYERIKLLLSGFDKVRGGGGFRVARDRGAEILWSCRPVALPLVFGRAQANNCVSPGQRPQQRKSRLLPTRPKRGPRGFGPWRLFGDLTSMFPETDHRKGALCQRPRSRQPRHRRGRHGD